MTLFNSKILSECLLIFFLFIVLKGIRYSIPNDLSYECNRALHLFYNWSVFIPISCVLLIFFIINLLRFRGKWRDNIANLFLLSPFALSLVFTVFKFLRNFIIMLTDS